MRYFIFIFIFLTYEFLFGFYFYSKYSAEVEGYHKRNISVAESFFTSLVKGYEMSYDDFHADKSDRLSALVSLANGESLEKRDEVRQKLLSEFMAFFNNKKLDALNGFHIFDVDGRSLLRFHQPLHYDDYIINKRHSLQKLNREFSYQKGLEVGAFVESYRFQYPLFYDGDFVGSYEYSVNFEALMSEMKKFYGDYYQLIFKAKSVEDVVLENMIDENYKKMEVESKYFYIKKNFHEKNIDEDRFIYLKNISDFKKALNSKIASMIDYEYDSKPCSVVVLPIDDIEGKAVSSMLIHINNSSVHKYRTVFSVEMFLASFLGLILYLYILKQIKHKKYISELLNLQRDMIVVGDGKNITDANSAFLNFFDYETVRDFESEHSCVCDMFIDEEGYLSNKISGLSWIEYITNNPSEEYRVKILNSSSQEIIFEIEYEKLKDFKKSFILFRDITDDIKLQATLQERANYDALTHIFNRGRFEYYLDKELERSARNGEKFSLIMFDIDHFKEINDTYGHDVGDSVLKELTSLISKHIRDVDIFARWGGEEFMIISLTNIEYSERFGEKLRKIIDKNTFTDVGHLSCSFGITQFHEKDSRDSIVKRCDNMLYSAKESGRNCVVSLR